MTRVAYALSQGWNWIPYPGLHTSPCALASFWWSHGVLWAKPSAHVSTLLDVLDVNHQDLQVLNYLRN